jgi:hypothetical protein
VRFFLRVHFAQRTAGASRHPAFPAPSWIRGREMKQSSGDQAARPKRRVHRRDVAGGAIPLRHTPSLRGALATKQSRVPPRRQSGLLRGACHRAARRADPVARNDVERACVAPHSRAPDAAQRPFDGALQSLGPIPPHRAVSPWVPARRRSAQRVAACPGREHPRWARRRPELCDVVNLPIACRRNFHLAVCLGL